MDSWLVPSCATLELLVMFFQVIGIASVCVSRFLPGTKWAWRARRLFILALIGLSTSGALLGQHDSLFAQFAGLTMTVLLIGMIAGGGSIELIAPNARTRRPEIAAA